MWSWMCLWIEVQFFCFQEFKFLRKKNDNQNFENVSINSETSEDGKRGKGYFTSSKSPFDIQTEEEESEDVLETNGVH